jgi:N-acetylneuraminate synthase
MIISTGMANDVEIAEAVEAARDGGCTELALLLCVSGYPAPAADYNLATLPDMVERYGVTVGLSDHTLDNVTAVASVALGGSIIEKHITMDRSGGGPDDSFSLEPSEFKSLCDNAKTAWNAIGKIDYSRKASELGNIKFRRSLYFVKDLAAGETITSDCIRSVRPGYGLAPKHLHDVIGKKAKRAIAANTPVEFECF